MTDVAVADVEAHIVELIARVETGEEMRILRHGKLIARLVPVLEPAAESRKPFDFAELENLTRGQPMGEEVVQKMRADARY